MSSLRAKIFGQYILLVLCSFIITGVILNYSLDNYFVTQLKNRLYKTADSVISSLVSVERSFGRLDASDAYENILNYHSITSNSYIIVFDHSGNIQAFSESVRPYITNGSIPSSMVSKVLTGDTVTETSDFNNFFNAKSIVVGKPLYVESHPVGGVFCITPVPYLREMKWEIFSQIFIAMSITLGVAALFAFFLSRQLSKPIKLISNAVKSIAKGDFDKRLNPALRGEMGQLALDFNEMATSLQNLEQMRKNFIGNVSHELRTPMTIITGFLEGILDGTIPQDKHGEYIRLVINETKRLTRLVNDLLDVAKIESGGKLTFDHFDVNELLRIALLKFESRIVEKNLDVRLILEGSTCMAFANMDSIERVVTNLIDNAVKFAGAQGYICLKTAIEGDLVYVTVENSGAGIPPEDIDHIWERFHKSDKSRSMDKTGVGLGLYIVKSILGQHNQHITAESVPGKHTRFTFTLQLSK